MSEKAVRVSAWTRPGAQLPLVRVRHGRQVLVCPSGPAINLLMHWNPDLVRTQPCLADHCSDCVSGSPRRPLSYCPVLLWSLWDSKLTWISAVVELPLSAGQSLDRRQGQQVWLSRSRPHGPISFADGRAPVSPRMNIVVSVTATLMSLWRLAPDDRVRLIKPGDYDPANDQRPIAEVMHECRIPDESGEQYGPCEVQPSDE
jgi:hypothetical protein